MGQPGHLFHSPPAAPVLVKDELLFYYGGTNMPHFANSKAFLGVARRAQDEHADALRTWSGPGDGSPGRAGGLRCQTGPRRVAHPAVPIERAEV